jgi:hypothetical protein
LQNALAALVAKNPAASAAALSEAYGQLGEIYHAYSLIAAARDLLSECESVGAERFPLALSARDVGPAGRSL